MYVLYKLVAVFVRDGHRQRSENMVFRTLKRLKLVHRKAIRRLLFVIVNNCSSVIELLQSPKRRLRKYPFSVSFTRNKRLTLHYILKGVNRRVNDELADRLYKELSDILKNRGYAIRFKEQIYRYTLDVLPFLAKFGKSLGKKRRKKINRR